MSGFYHNTIIPPAYEGICLHARLMTIDDETLVVHDLYHLSRNTDLSFWEKRRENRWLKKGVAASKKIVVFSLSTKKELLKLFPESEERIELHKPVAREGIVPIDEDARDIVRYQFTQGDAYFLYRGPIHPAASLINLLKGFSIFKKKMGSNMKLAMYGPKGSYSTDFLASVETYKYREDLVFVGPLTDTEEISLLSSAYALVHPCRWERFGIPVVDAMKAGVAVLCVQDSAMSEYCGMAGMYFNEDDPADIGEKLCRIYKEEQMREQMIGTGLLR
ncbi:MAG: glycosyltransferase [bacterium]|jgi:glycosyltransferase involved in cell wall biosynthesis